jgi:hypothetical protein
MFPECSLNAPKMFPELTNWTVWQVLLNDTTLNPPPRHAGEWD